MNKLVLGLIALLIGGAVAGYFGFAQYFSAPKVEELSARPLFFPMDKFVMSVAGDPTSRYLVLELTLVSHKASTIAALKEATPLLRNALVAHFASSSHLEVKVAMQQIDKVQQQLLSTFNQSLTENKFEHQLDKVLITNIFIQ